MNNYKHFSFDLWMTLIKSNPLFKKQRAHFFFTHFNPLQKSMEEVLDIFRFVDLMCNSINEKTGGNIDADEMYLMVIYRLGGNAAAFNGVDLKRLCAQMEQLVFENMPLIYCADTKDVLTEIKGKNGNTMSILSNTAFIKGATLRTVLKHLQIDHFFDFQLYSDEWGISKPNHHFFKIMFDQISSLRRDNIAPGEVVHIGDNPVADIAAANAFGMNSFLINSNDKLITDFLK